VPMISQPHRTRTREELDTTLTDMAHERWMLADADTRRATDLIAYVSGQSDSMPDSVSTRSLPASSVCRNGRQARWGRRIGRSNGFVCTSRFVVKI
jgi:hypothetical protein